MSQSLICNADTVRAPLRLYCFHHAGGSAASFAAWEGLQAGGMQLCAVELPGRRRSHDAARAASLGQLVGALADQLGELHERIAPRPAFAFYGHSLGALVAFETARALRRRGLDLPLALCVSGRRAPRCPLPCAPLSELPDQALVDCLRTLGGVPADLLASRRWRELHLPALRHDLSLSDAYSRAEEPPLELALFGFIGEDDPVVSGAEFDAWRHETTGPAVLRSLSGGHFFDREGDVALRCHLACDLDALSVRQPAAGPVLTARTRNMFETQGVCA